MRKFNAVLKEKQAISEQVLEERTLNQFKSVYGELLEQYEVTEFYDLDENTQVAFLRELNEYWTEEEGISKKGKKFLETKSSILTESSTPLQKKSYLKNKATAVINETLRQADLKNRLYDVLDEMYKSIKAEEISDVLPADAISGTILESFGSALEGLMTEMVYELSSESEELNENKKDPTAHVRNRGDVVFPAESNSVKDDKDHFPINSEAQARNALARASQYSSSPSWYSGSLDTLVKKVSSAVHKKYPGIKVSKAGKTPGKQS
jgi:hypothetical protein